MKKKETYRKRIIDEILRRKLSGVGAVLLEGPKWCGKTTSCERQAKSVLYMADPDTLERNLAQAETSIKELLEGERPRLIDEWQIVPKFWDAVRFAVDFELKLPCLAFLYCVHYALTITSPSS